MDTFALLSSTQVALKEQEQECASLKDQHYMKLAEKEQSHQAEEEEQRGELPRRPHRKGQGDLAGPR